jgi:hypothetical protein
VDVIGHQTVGENADGGVGEVFADQIEVGVAVGGGVEYGLAIGGWRRRTGYPHQNARRQVEGNEEL